MEFKIIAGDFSKNSKFESDCLVYPGGSTWLKGKIERIEVVTEENKKKILGSAGWGVTGAVLGGLIAAPVALAAGLAGILKGGRTKEICFACYLKDGKKFMAVADSKTYQKIMALTF